MIRIHVVNYTDVTVGGWWRAISDLPSIGRKKCSKGITVGPSDEVLSSLLLVLLHYYGSL